MRVEEMNRLGMFVDVSHCSYRTSMEAIEYSQQPVIFSHSNPRKLTPHGRNISDEQILACVKTGGLIGVNGIGGFLGCDQPDAARFADHVDYLLNLAGPRHVGIALDYAFPVGNFSVEEILANHAKYWPAEEYQGGHGYVAPEVLFDVTAQLLARGHSEKTVKAVLRENFLRLAHEIWK